MAREAPPLSTPSDPLERWNDALTALQLLHIDPHGFGGVCLRAPHGPVRERWLQALAGLGLGLVKVPGSVDSERLLGGIDLALAAGGHAEFGPIAEWDTARFMKMLEVHVGGTFYVCKYVTPVMKARGTGSIVTIASTAAFMANNNNVPYGAAKAGITGITRQFSLEALPEVRINCIAPGRTITGMTSPLMIQRGGDMEKGEEIFGAAIPMKRMGTPAELAAAICFFLSDDASFITGQTLIVDGGETIS